MFIHSFSLCPFYDNSKRIRKRRKKVFCLPFERRFKDFFPSIIRLLRLSHHRLFRMLLIIALARRHHISPCLKCKLLQSLRDAVCLKARNACTNRMRKLVVLIIERQIETRENVWNYLGKNWFFCFDCLKHENEQFLLFIIATTTHETAYMLMPFLSSTLTN